MVVVIYQNIKGIFEPSAFELWKSYVSLFGCRLDENTTKNARTITVYRKEENAAFTIFHSETEPHIYLDFLRLEPASQQLVKLIDRLIYQMGLSGEKQIISEFVRASTFFNKGKVVKADPIDDSPKFELLLLRETIYGFIHLSLDNMIEFKRSGNLEKVEEIKETISNYQKQLTKLIEQINTK